MTATEPSTSASSRPILPPPPCSAAPLAGRHLTELASPLEASLLEEWDRAVRTGEPQRADQPSADGTRWFDCTITPIGGERAAIVFHDVTDHRAVEATCASGRRAWRSPSTSRSWHLVVDLVTGEGEMDARGAEIVGLPPGDVDVQEAQRTSIHPEDLAVEPDIGAGIAAGGTFALAYRVIYPDGSVHHVLSRAQRA